MNRDFTTVTEITGEEVSTAQVERLAQRYYWAGDYCRDKDVLEVACGAGQGLGYLASVAHSVRGGDITPALVERAVTYYGERVPVTLMDAENLRLEAASVDVVILFEAIYYLQSAERFVDEVLRVLRPGGVLLVATANRDLFDFNPSPFSVRYYGVPELGELLRRRGFHTVLFGGSPASSGGLVKPVLRLAKMIAVKFHLIPGSMRGKQMLKRLVFGTLVPMPDEVTAGLRYEAPVPIEDSRPDTVHQVIFCAATHA
jgi:SAM-dependent methyltransferase